MHATHFDVQLKLFRPIGRLLSKEVRCTASSLGCAGASLCERNCSISIYGNHFISRDCNAYTHKVGSVAEGKGVSCDQTLRPRPVPRVYVRRIDLRLSVGREVLVVVIVVKAPGRGRHNIGLHGDQDRVWEIRENYADFRAGTGVVGSSLE